MKNNKLHSSIDHEFLANAFDQFKQLTAQCAELSNLCFTQFGELINLNAAINGKLGQSATPQEFASALYNGLVDGAEVMNAAVLSDAEEMLKLYQNSIANAMHNYVQLQTASLKIFDFCLGLTPSPSTIKLDDLAKSNWATSQEAAGIVQKMLEANFEQFKQHLEYFKKKKT